MIPRFCMLSIYLGCLGAAQESVKLPRSDGVIWSTNDKFYMSNRAYNQEDAFGACSYRDDLQLVEIHNSIKTDEVAQFLYLNEFQSAWTAGVTGTNPFKEYYWGEGDYPMNYTNWKTEPSNETVPEEDWLQSGIVVTRKLRGVWLLELKRESHPALCEKVDELVP